MSLVKGSTMFSARNNNFKLSFIRTLMKRTSDTRTHITSIKSSMSKVKSKKKDTTLLSSEQNMQEVQLNKSEKLILNNISSLSDHHSSDISLFTLNKHVHITEKI